MPFGRAVLPKAKLRSGQASVRNLAGFALRQTSGDDLGRRVRAEPLELVESTSNGAIIVRVGKGEGGFVRAADLRPQLRCARPVAGDLDRIRLGRPVRRLRVES